MEAKLTANAREILKKRYLRSGFGAGGGVETIDEWVARIARAIAASPNIRAEERAAHEQMFAKMLTDLRFIPNTPCLMNAGLPRGQLAACFVLPIDDDMGAEETGIFATLRNAALIQQTGGGIGFDWSSLRPAGDRVASSGGSASGPVSFLRIFDTAFGGIAQGGCLTSDTLIMTDCGTMRFDEIIDITTHGLGWKEGASIGAASTSEGPRPVIRTYCNGVAPILRVVTISGIEIKGTAEHKVRVLSGDGPQWKHIGDLAQGDNIIMILGQHQGKPQHLALPTTLASPGMFPTEITPDLAFALGYLAGNGTVGGTDDDHRIIFGVPRESYLMRELPEMLRALFPGCAIDHQQRPSDHSATFIIDSAYLKQYLILNGISKRESWDERVPARIRKSPADIVAHYLRGLFETGCHRSPACPCLCSPSKVQIEEVAALLIGLGCPVTITKQTNQDCPGQIGRVPMNWHLCVESPAGLQAWNDKVGYHPRSRLASIIKSRKVVRPVGCLWVSGVAFVEHAGSEPTFDMEVADNHSYIANGMFVSNSRRGANMAVLRVDHPDIEQFVACKKQSEHTLTNFNISVALTDDFMRAVVNDGEFALINPRGRATARKVRARDLMRKISECAHTNGEPGVLFIDRINEENPVPNLYRIVATNPCVAADTVIATDQGPRTVASLVGVPFRAVVNGEAYHSRGGFFLTGFKPVYNLRTREGHSLRLTRDHKVFARRQGHPAADTQMIAAEDLCPGDIIMINGSRQATFECLTADGSENVYDCTVEDLHKFSANSIIVSNCGEVPLGPFENCCLGHINLARHVDATGRIDFTEMSATVREAVHFLDAIIDVNAYVPAVPKLREAALRTRRIGLGIMGLADALIYAGFVYGSRESAHYAEDIMATIRYVAMDESANLARDIGSFPAFSQSKFADPKELARIFDNLAAQESTMQSDTYDPRRPRDWKQLARKIQEHGLRNAYTIAIAPTGTTSLIAGVDGYGCEPIFSLSYARTLGDGSKMQFCCESACAAIRKAITDARVAEAIIAHISAHGRVPTAKDIPELATKREWQHVLEVVGATALNVSPEGHLRIQSALQKWVDNSISKTINCPFETTVDEVEKMYLDAWQCGLKGVAIYRSGSRTLEALTTTAIAAPTSAITPVIPKKKRPSLVPGFTHKCEIGLGHVFTTVNFDHANGDPFEVFVSVSKSGTEVQAGSEALGRLISMLLRLNSSVSARERLDIVVEQLSGIGGSRDHRDSTSKRMIRSIPDAVAAAIEEITRMSDSLAGVSAPHTPSPILRDICPQCHKMTLVRIERCAHCEECSYSAC